MTRNERPMLLSIVAAVVCVQLAAAVHVTVPSGGSECFSVEAETFKHGISLNYEVLRGVAEALETELTDGKEQIVYANTGVSGRYVSPIGEGGLHSVCFKNVMSPVGDVAIGFSFHADDPSHEDTQAYMKAITNHHNEMITSTHSRIMWWTLIEMAVLTAVSLAQISFLRRTLEVRRIL
ncbi:hypothetical protein BBP00_00004569 [Phytophthora kernoviae]|uniref:GOLD domain-containing protein n=1 Tax=Phytophthora kernoviae TaxID=325452 RepID=A0A3F2RSX3_9STRA|nr:hypothetical protein BBP00_00004569 [Phytophthora kernoviae]